MERRLASSHVIDGPDPAISLGRALGGLGMGRVELGHDKRAWK
jgi:hypothetical protein